MSEWISFFVLAIVLLIGARLFAGGRYYRTIRNVIMLAATFRIVGVLARHAMIFYLYDGVSDAVGYFDTGEEYAERLRALDFSIFDSENWRFGHLWGTDALRYTATIVITVIGPTMRGSFLVFSAMAFVGMLCVLAAYRRAVPGASLRACALLLLCWPSMWFWPSSIGKEAVVLLGCGIVVLGYVGVKGRIRWPLFAAGLGIVFLIRPHVAGVLVACAALAEWMATTKRWTPWRMAQTAATAALAVWLVVTAFGELGVQSADLEGISEVIEYRSELTARGGSQIDSPGVGVAAIPMAFANVLFRPFLFEASNPLAAVSALEVTLFWLLMFRYRRGLRAAIRGWRTNRLLRFAIPFSLMYTFMIGITFQNLGIIARQRVIVLPMLLVILATAIFEDQRSRNAKGGA